MKRDDANYTLPTTGALSIEVRSYIGTTSDVSVVLGDAASEIHTSVFGALHDNDLVRATCSVKRLPLTVVAFFC